MFYKIKLVKDHAFLRNKLENVRKKNKNMTLTLTKQKNVNKPIEEGLPIVDAALFEALTLLDKMGMVQQMSPSPNFQNQESQRMPRTRKSARVSSGGGGNTPTIKEKEEKEEDNAPFTSKRGRI